MTNLGELYTNFFRIDLDAPGGYARVADVVVRQEEGVFVHRAFKLMRHELDEKQVGGGIQRFENELNLLIEITKDEHAPSAITRIYDSGFVEAELSKSLHKLQNKEEKLNPIPNLEIVPTGTNIQKFLGTKSALMEKEPDRWLPYLVVDLAPYDDSLLRQIRALSADAVNLYGLPVNTIIDMTLQILDVMDYLHKNLRYAYKDWKPEHIYWNEATRQLKLIDWNVTARLDGGPTEKQIIREDIRMFSGAALYCSLALTDPEESKSIGPTPTIPRNKVPVIPPRYWTDNPNFYQRGEILDEEIKGLVQKALDPNQGFNSPQELKNALVQYAKQIDKQGDEQIDKKKDGDLIPKLPFDAVQRYRRARSYIAAGDYMYAAMALEVAIVTAKAAGTVYPDAEKLLKSVNDILKVGEFKQKVKLALELEQWKDVVKLYNKAIAREPGNTAIKKEYENLQALLRSESELRTKGFFRIFTNLFKLGTVLKSTKDVINPDNHLYNYVKRQYKQIRMLQMSSVFLLLIAVSFASVLIGKPKFYQLFPATTTPTSIPSPVPSVTPTLEPTAIFTITSTLIPTNTLEPTATAITVKAYGILFSSYFYPFEQPNGARTESALKYKQPLKIIGERIDHGSLWYECTWEIDGVVGRGWILAEKIKIVQAPTPTSTPTP